MAKKIPRIRSMDELLGLEDAEQEFSEETGQGVKENRVEYLSPASIRMFRSHPFHLYEGDRLKELVESISQNGILVPAIVRKIEPDENGYCYEMLAGHNRQQGAMIAGLDKIPCIVKEGLSDKEAWIYVIETNVIQRSFTELCPSEKAAILSVRYQKVISQGKRNDIIKEIKRLENGWDEDGETTCGNEFHKSRDTLGAEYDLTGRMVANYLRINELLPTLKKRIDNGEITLSSGVNLSYLSEEEQGILEHILSEGVCKINSRNAVLLRGSHGKLTDELMREILIGNRNVTVAKPITFKIKPAIYQKYFTDKISQKEFDNIIDQALSLYFAEGKTAE